MTVSRKASVFFLIEAEAVSAVEATFALEEESPATSSSLPKYREEKMLIVFYGDYFVLVLDKESKML
jgi:hypothetical protein